MKLSDFRKQPNPDISGEKLVADFHSALLNLATMDAATAEAQRSEADITEALQYASGAARGVFLAPGNISPAAQENLMKGSVDAHLKKVQAAQITSTATAQVTQLQHEDIQKYIGRKVRVTRLGNTPDVFVPLSATGNGQLQRGTYARASITGTISDLSFEKNALVITPTLVGRTILPARKFFLVGVIDMQTLMPAVKIQLI